jgi:hypothetical protein
MRCGQTGSRARRWRRRKRGDVIRRNQHYRSIEEVLQREGRTLLQIAKATICAGEGAPALCRYGCKVDLEGTCDHGCPSELKALMIRGYGWNEIPGKKK